MAAEHGDQEGRDRDDTDRAAGPVLEPARLMWPAAQRDGFLRRSAA
jgi:hypothetical protein